MYKIEISKSILLIGMAFANCSFFVTSLDAQQKKPNDKELHGGLTLDQWIAQAKSAPKLSDRHQAMQTLRNLGIARNRTRTLRTFTELLSDEAPTVRSLSAVGLKKAGNPSDPKAANKLAELISKDLSKLRLPKSGVEVGGEFGGTIRAIGALEVIGGVEQLPALKKVFRNKRIDSFIRQVAGKAISTIEKRIAKQ